MKKLFSVLFFLASIACAQAQTLGQDYWQVADTNPTTQVWQASSGSYISNTASGYTTWLTAISINPTYIGYAQTICGVANNGSGLFRLTLCAGQPGTGGWATGQFKTVTGVGGATTANGAWTITVVDATHVDLQSSTFAGVYTSGGVIGAGRLIDTAAHLYAFINAQNTINVSQLSAIQVSITGTQTLTNPLSLNQNVVITTGAQIVTLPQANLFGSIPIGYQITFRSTGVSAWTLNDSSANTIATVPVDYSIVIVLTTNITTNGTYVYWFVPTIQLACADLSNGATGCSTATGTSGATIPLNNGSNTLSGINTFTGARNQFGSGAGTPSHVATGQTTPPALTSCGGGSPAITGTDTAGIVTMGTSATGCVITFNVAYTGTPFCVVTWIATPLASQSYVTSNASITLTQTSTSGNKVQYVCVAPSGG